MNEKPLKLNTPWGKAQSWIAPGNTTWKVKPSMDSHPTPNKPKEKKKAPRERG